MKVKELAELLQKQDQDADVILMVAWADDGAVSDDGGELRVNPSRLQEKAVVLSGWMSDTAGELSWAGTEEDE